MKMIISPAKKMQEDTDSLPWHDLPCFLSSTRRILASLSSMDYSALKKLWGCNDSIAEENGQRLEHMQLETGLTPALLAYQGIQYQYMAPNVFTREELEYVQEHLFILSGFYGVLRPFDGIRAYRLEMGAKLSIDGHKDLYSFWGDMLSAKVFSEDDIVLDLASKEYSQCISRYVPAGKKLVSCSFAQLVNGKAVEKATLCKMARGEMVRYLAQERIDCLEGVMAFDRLGHSFSRELSDENKLVFLKQ